MKALLIFLAIVLVSILWPANLSLGACPADPNDNGLCDTLYVEVHPPDAGFSGSGSLIRVPIRVTNDLTNPMDSIAEFLIPLCYTHSNPTKYCSLSSYWNTTYFSGSPAVRSIFRHLDGEHNWMMDQAGYPQGAWSAILQLDGTSHFWLSLYGENPAARRFTGGSRVLIATMTFRVQDTMTICIDSCFWPPSDRLAFSRSDAVLYIPRQNFPDCFSISYRIGDVTKDGRIDVSDIIFLIGYLYKSGPAPNPLYLGNTNCDGVVDISDVIFLLNYVFRFGPLPSC